MTPPASPPPFRIHGSGIRLQVRLTPRASADAVTGQGEGPDGAYVAARVRAIPDKGAANDALTRLIAAWLGCPRSAVRLAGGGKSRMKALDIDGDPVALAGRLTAKLKDLGDEHG